jgi:hypothetical protein
MRCFDAAEGRAVTVELLQTLDKRVHLSDVSKTHGCCALAKLRMSFTFQYILKYCCIFIYNVFDYS